MSTVREEQGGSKGGIPEGVSPTRTPPRSLAWAPLARGLSLGGRSLIAPRPHPRRCLQSCPEAAAKSGSPSSRPLALWVTGLGALSLPRELFARSGSERLQALPASASSPCNFPGRFSTRNSWAAPASWRGRGGAARPEGTPGTPRPARRPCSPTPGSASCPTGLAPCSAARAFGRWRGGGSGGGVTGEGPVRPRFRPLREPRKRGTPPAPPPPSGLGLWGSSLAGGGGAGTIGGSRGGGGGRGGGGVPRGAGAQPESGFPGGTSLIPGWGPEPARPPRLHRPRTHFRACVYTTD